MLRVEGGSRFEISEARDMRDGSGRIWNLAVEDRTEPCETIFHEGERISERCGPDVRPPAD